MTTVQKIPSATLRKQDIVALNVNMILANTSLMKRDLAKAMGVKPQSIARLLSSSQTWSLDQAVNAAQFIGIPLSMLMDPGLTPASAIGYLDSHKEGGLPVLSVEDFRIGRGWNDDVAPLGLAA